MKIVEVEKKVVYGIKGEYVDKSFVKALCACTMMDIESVNQLSHVSSVSTFRVVLVKKTNKLIYEGLYCESKGALEAQGA